MESNLNFFQSSSTASLSDPLLRLAGKIKELNINATRTPTIGEFRKITHQDMPIIMEYLKKESGRTTDFSYGGVLMWVDYFNYEFAIYKDTLFIKGVVENDISRPAFSMPVGELSLRESVDLLREYCEIKGIDLEFSAVPEYALDDFSALDPVNIEELKDWGDYLYDAAMLSSLKGKKMMKKRNHVNKFVASFPDWKAEALTPDNVPEALAFMDVFDLEGDSTPMAESERRMSRDLLAKIAAGDSKLKGMILYAGGKVCAYTIGDIKGDTLFIHVEKATRMVPGSYEMINHAFAKEMCGTHPEIIFINREDDSGDIGLRMAKESYHPVTILKKYNISF